VRGVVPAVPASTPQVQDAETKAAIPAADLQIESWPPRYVGGQHVGVSMGLQITHLPTGIVARVCLHRSQHTNKQIAMDMILSALTHPRFSR
jgi:protein subunit release factor A